jgi:hypothetical protein
MRQIAVMGGPRPFADAAPARAEEKKRQILAIFRMALHGDLTVEGKRSITAKSF